MLPKVSSKNSSVDLSHRKVEWGRFLLKLAFLSGLFPSQTTDSSCKSRNPQLHSFSINSSLSPLLFSHSSSVSAPRPSYHDICSFLAHLLALICERTQIHSCGDPLRTRWVSSEHFLPILTQINLILGFKGELLQLLADLKLEHQRQRLSFQASKVVRLMNQGQILGLL